MPAYQSLLAACARGEGLSRAAGFAVEIYNPVLVAVDHELIGFLGMVRRVKVDVINKGANRERQRDGGAYDPPYASQGGFLASLDGLGHGAGHPFAGTFIPVAHQGGTTAFEFTADMNSPDPVIKPRSGGQPFPDFNLQMTPGEQDTTAVSFLANSGSFTWSLTVTYLIGTQSHQQQINPPGGQPFAVTAPAAKYTVEYQVVPFAGLQLASPG